MIIDAHTHIFPAAICSDRGCFFTGEPEFELLYNSPRARLIGAEDLLAAMDAQGVDRSVVFGFPWKSAEAFKRHNDYIMEAVGRYPERLVGLGCFDLWHAKAQEETLRCIDGGLSGIGELAFYRGGIDAEALERLAPIMEACAPRKLPVMLHTNEPVGHRYPGKAPMTLHQIYELIRRFPENRVVLAHWGGGIFFYNLLKKEVKESLQNVYYDTAASPFLYDGRIYALAARLAGAEKILFGSDYPLIQPSRYFEELASVGLPEAEVTAICGGNAARLFGLRPGGGN
jgi:predicted TIM-barrel fold metal-dependent hydrolase